MDPAAPPAGRPALRELLHEDFVTHGRRPLHPGFHALAVHRLGRAIAGSASLRARLLRPAFRVARVLVVSVYGIELPPDATVGRRVHLPHPQGVVVVPGAVIGDDCMLRHNVTLGVDTAHRGGRPTIGDRVQFGPGAMVIGAVQVGDDVLVGPGALVIDDVPAGSRVLAPVATVRPPKCGSEHAGPQPAADGEPHVDVRDATVVLQPSQRRRAGIRHS